MQTDSTVSSPLLPTMYCPVCGAKLAAYWQIFEYKTIHRQWVEVTCWEKDCAVGSRTMSADRIATGLAEWHTQQRYDVHSGEMLK